MVRTKLPSPARVACPTSPEPVLRYCVASQTDQDHAPLPAMQTPPYAFALPFYQLQVYCLSALLIRVRVRVRVIKLLPFATVDFLDCCCGAVGHYVPVSHAPKAW